MTSPRRYELSIVAVFLVVLAAYLLVALVFHAPQGYYGTIEQPRFADPWIARSETVLSGGVLYRDVFTATPPLTNFLIILPSLVPILVGNVNPWATLSFMLFFSLFNLFTALVLLRMGKNTAAGFWAAILFLLNPLTFGNTVLRRQDESILVFFFALSLLLILRDENTKAAVAIGLSLLIKLSAGLLIPVALLHKRDWRYVVIPSAIFLLALAPFIILAGRDAIFWDFTTRDAQHPFQFDGVSLVALWNRFHVESGQIPLLPIAIIMVLGVAAAIAFIVWRRLGVIESLIVLTTVVFVLSPKLHTGYFSLLVMLLAPFIKDWRMATLYLLFGATAIVADYYKWPIADFQIAFWIMVVVLAFMVFLAVGIRLQARRGRSVDLLPPFG